MNDLRDIIALGLEIYMGHSAAVPFSVNGKEKLAEIDIESSTGKTDRFSFAGVFLLAEAILQHDGSTASFSVRVGADVVRVTISDVPEPVTEH